MIWLPYIRRKQRLNLAVKRNMRRFPEDFMFQLTEEESKSLRFQFETLEKGRHSKYLPYVFTELGVSMLSSILRSQKAIDINILIMRVFVRLRNLFASNEELRRKVAELDYEQKKTKEDVRALMSAVDMLLDPPPEAAKERVGFI